MKMTRLCNGKAIALETDDEVILQSYETVVAKIKNGEVVFLNEDIISRTTARYIHEFCRLYNVTAPKLKITY